MHTLGSHYVNIHGIYQIISFVSKGMTCKLCLQQWDNILTLYYVYTHIVVLPLKFVASQAKCIFLYKNLQTKVQRCCANIYFNIPLL